MNTPEKRAFSNLLVVSEDPDFIVSMQDLLQRDGVQVRGCLGPANVPCSLKLQGTCRLAGEADVVLVDAPRSGSFLYEWASMPAGDYAERLSRAYPGLPVILCGAPEGRCGPTGELTHVGTRAGALEVLMSLSPAADCISAL